MPERLKKLNILIIGQLITSRTETIENYLKSRVKTLGLIGFPSVYSIRNVSRCMDYYQGKQIRQFKIPVILLKKPRWYKQPLLILYFTFLLFNILVAAFRLRRRYDVAIGISCFSVLSAVVLKKLGIVKKVIDYTIDYYIQPKKLGFSSFVIYIIKLVDRFCVRNSEVVWNITSRILYGRGKISRISPDQYKHCVVPMCYDSSLLCVKDYSQIDRFAMGFVGTLSHNQGLQLVVEAMPEIVARMPGVRLDIIGYGPYAETIKKLVKKTGLQSNFNFYGFIEDDHRVLDILSRCAIGLATWTSSPDDNAIYADPGKPKLYAFCGIPSIITKTPEISEIMHREKAGIAINYNKEELITAVQTLLGNEEKLKEYRYHTYEFAKRYTSEIVYDHSWRETLNFLSL